MHTEINRSVALVGRPNVGKSRLFNRLTRRRISIVHDQPGVTRDVISSVVDDDYLLMDTGGLGMEIAGTPAMLTKATHEQVDFAVASACVVVLVLDAQTGLVPQDEIIAKRLRESGKRTILVLNKSENASQVDRELADFFRLGLGEPLPISAEHNTGIGELREAIEEALGPKPEQTEAVEGVDVHRIRICLVGKPNVGKSSIGNRLLNSDRLIVSEIPGTTRDAISHNLDYPSEKGDVWHFELVDTAGLRAAPKLSTSVEYFSSVRTQQAVAASDVAILVIDALGGVTKQDKRVAGEIVKAGKGLVVVVNKWDLALAKFKSDPLQGFKDIEEFRRKFLHAVLEELFFLPRCPVVFTSAKENLNLGELLRYARSVYDSYTRELSTAKVNREIQKIIAARAPNIVSGRRLKIYYALQVSRAPQRVRIFCNEPLRLEEEYERHLERSFQEAFKLYGVSIKFQLVGKPEMRRPLYDSDQTRGAKSREQERKATIAARRKKKQPPQKQLSPKKKQPLKKKPASKKPGRMKN